MTTKPKGLHAKLAEVMAEAGRIPKNGTAPAAMGGFKFVEVGDAADTIRKALGDRGVSMLPSAVEVVREAEHQTSNGKTMTTQTIRTTWTLTDGESGETAVIQSLGTGADTGDKFSPKAQSNAMKYALLMGFLLSTGDDPEQHDTSDRQARPAGEQVDLIGSDVLSGKVSKGGSDRYQAEWRQTPTGPVIGFAVKGTDKTYSQVGVMGPIAEALALAHPDPATLIGQHVRMRGRFYTVRQPGRTTYTRVIVGQSDNDFLETDDLRIPASDSGAPPAGVEVQPGEAEAPSAPMFDETEQAAIDAAIAAA